MFGFPVICYLFLGGLGGGVCVVASALGLLTPGKVLISNAAQFYGSFNRSMYITVFLSLSLGALCLLSDGINLSALMNLFIPPRTAYLSIGAMALLIAAILSAFMVLLWGRNFKPRKLSFFWLRVLQVLSLFAGFLVCAYTGLYLCTMKAVPLWNSPWLLALFILSSLSCGIVFTAVILQLTGAAQSFMSFLKRLTKADSILIVLELVCSVVFILTLLFCSPEGSAQNTAELSLRHLLLGSNAWIFWIGFIGMGLMGALVFNVICLRNKAFHENPYSVLMPSFFVLTGSFAMRASIVMAGAHPILGS